MRIALVVLVVAAGAFGMMLTGCGSDESAVTADTGPFEAAIAQYLQAKSMGMAVAEFRSLEVEGDTARAVCRMQEKSGMHNVKVTWRFTFARSPQGGWEVTERVAE
jgi:hypothetical protein